MNPKFNNALNNTVKFVKKLDPQSITNLVEIFLMLLQGQNYTKEMDPIRDGIVKFVKELDPQSITNLITPETVVGFLGLFLVKFKERTIKTFKNCINKE